MSPTAVDLLTGAAALGCGAVGGVFFTFSTFTMQGLTRLPDDHGAVAMQSINVTAVRPPFMTLLFAPGLLCTALLVHAVVTWPREPKPLLLGGAVLYLVGTLGVTIARNVPLNDALAAPGGGATLWHGYVRCWTRWNHVRTVSSLGAAAAFVAAAG